MDTPFTWVYAVYGAQEYADVRVDARFTNQAASPASIGLICRYSATEGWLEYNVYSDGTYSVLYGQWLADGIANYLPVLSSSSSAILPSGSSQEIGLICSGTTLSLLIDQTIIRSVDVSRFELATGKVGLTVSSFENIPVMTAFDWVRSASHDPTPALPQIHRLSAAKIDSWGFGKGAEGGRGLSPI
jgi:hypothetical protein